MMLTLPSPRVSYYLSSDYFKIQRGITTYTNQIAEDLGFFSVSMQLDVLSEMQTYSYAIMFLGLIFDIIILLLAVLSVLLIYSLLMISVESKSFEFGVMRMVGLSSSGIIVMLVLQSIMFVLPSVFVGFLTSVPTLAGLYSLLFDANMGVSTSPAPSGFAIA